MPTVSTITMDKLISRTEAINQFISYLRTHNYYICTSYAGGQFDRETCYSPIDSNEGVAKIVKHHLVDLNEL